jgi:hypothetical protein
LQFNSFTIIKTKRKKPQQQCEEKGRLRTQNQKKKKALSSCHEILRQQRPPGDGWSDARKEKRKCHKSSHTHIPMHDNVDVWATSGTVV